MASPGEDRGGGRQGDVPRRPPLLSPGRPLPLALRSRGSVSVDQDVSRRRLQQDPAANGISGYEEPGGLLRSRPRPCPAERARSDQRERTSTTDAAAVTEATTTAAVVSAAEKPGVSGKTAASSPATTPSSPSSTISLRTCFRAANAASAASVAAASTASHSH